MEGIENLPTENQEQRKRDDTGSQSERKDLGFELRSSCSSALLRVAENIKTDKWGDDERLPFRQTADGKQNKSEIEIAALQKEKPCDQKRRDVDIEITERHAVEYERGFERCGENEIASESIKPERSRQQKNEKRTFENDERTGAKRGRAFHNCGQDHERQRRIIGVATGVAADKAAIGNLAHPVAPNTDVTCAGGEKEAERDQ